MSELTEKQFCRFVRDYLRRHPDVFGPCVQSMNAGLCDALVEATRRAVDMEIALASMCAKRFRNSERELVMQKLAEWKGQTFLKWDWLTEQS